MGRTRSPSSAGLNVTLTPEEEGTWHFSLTDDTGVEVHSKGGYKNDKSARTGAAQWVGMHYDVGTQEVPPRGRKHADVGSNAQLVRVMRKKADANTSEAARMRLMADQLEMEAKRLTAAADVLEGPEA